MADDLEAFLRQAAQRRAARRKPPEKPSEPRSQPVSQAPEPQISRPFEPFHALEVPESDQAEVIDAEVLPPIPAQTEQGGKAHVGSTDFAERAEHLGAEVGLADDKMTARLHRKFDHRLGAFDDSPGMPDEPVAISHQPLLSADQLAAMFQDAQSVRQAILMSEILTPPYHRW